MASIWPRRFQQRRRLPRIPYFDQVRLSEWNPLLGVSRIIMREFLSWPVRTGAAVLLAVSWMSPVCAHPHVFVDARAEILFDGQGRMTAIRHVWEFDRAFSAFASQGLDKDGDGVLSAKELAPLAKTNVTSLNYYGFFTS